MENISKVVDYEYELNFELRKSLLLVHIEFKCLYNLHLIGESTYIW